MTQVPVVESSVVPAPHPEASMTQVPVVESSVVPAPHPAIDEGAGGRVEQKGAAAAYATRRHRSP